MIFSAPGDDYGDTPSPFPPGPPLSAERPSPVAGSRVAAPSRSDAVGALEADGGEGHADRPRGDEEPDVAADERYVERLARGGYPDDPLGRGLATWRDECRAPLPPGPSRNYPVGESVNDPRFTTGLVLAIVEVLVAHGYPEPTARDFVDLSLALFGLLHGDD